MSRLRRQKSPITNRLKPRCRSELNLGGKKDRCKMALNHGEGMHAWWNGEGRAVTAAVVVLWKDGFGGSRWRYRNKEANNAEGRNKNRSAKARRSRR